LADESPNDKRQSSIDPQMTKVPYFSTIQSSADTGKLQFEVLTKINQALSRGSITPDRATTSRLSNTILALPR